MNKEEQLNRRIAELEEQLRQAQREVRLTKLRRQVTPHFLFNTISVAVSLVMQSPKTATRFLRLVAQMYRYLLLYGNEYSVPIEQEMEMLRQYYELMSLRHVESIKLRISPKATKLRRHSLPPLALQGLLENAIKHNVHSTDEPLLVTIDVEDGHLVVENRIRPLLSGSDSTRMGLAYMNETMQLLFGREIIVRNDGETFSVKIPLV